MKLIKKMKKLLPKTIRTNLTIWFLVLALAPLFIGMLITYDQQKKELEQETYDKLTAIRDLKVQQVNNWLNERVGDLKTVSSSSEFVEIEDSFSKSASEKEQKDLDNYENIRSIMGRYVSNYVTYEELFIMNPTTGIIELSSNNESEGQDKSDREYFTLPAKTGELYIGDIYYSIESAENEMIFSIPIFCVEHNSRDIVGIMAMRVDLNNSLYPLLLNKTGLGKTGETLIVNKDVVVLNELRWYEDAPLHLKLNAGPTILASQGETGIAKGVDYRGVSMLSAYTYIPKTGWGFVAKQDLAELNAPIDRLIRYSIILLACSMVVVLLIVSWVSKRISGPIVLMSQNAQKIKNGDLLVRNDIQAGNELEILAESINSMADSIESRVSNQENIITIAAAMVDYTTQQVFSQNLLKELMKTTNANMGTFYVLNEQRNEFEHFLSMGVNDELLKPFSAENPEGEFWQAVEKREIVHFRNIPEDTVFTYRTVAGDMLPREIITIPVVVDTTVVALISLISIKKFGDNCHDILQLSWTNINSSYSRLLANEKTKALAERMAIVNQQLESQTEELQEQTEELQEQSEELQEQNIELERQRKQGEETNRLKSEFLSNMSHELRTPLNSIMALSRVLIMQAEDKLSEEENNYLKIVERNGKNLLYLINDILDLSKIEAGKIELHPTTSSLQTLLNNIRDSLFPIVQNKGLEFRLNFAEGLQQVVTDEGKLHQVLQNIISNAVKFTEKGFVDVAVSFTSEKISIVVKDTGIGISRQALPHIFEEFRQADGSSSRQYEGTGLGLAIAYKLIKNLSGDIQVVSELGEGTLFTITIPMEWQGEVDTANVPTFKPIAYKPEQKTILVVDDDPEYLKEISRDLEEAGYKTLRAASGKMALNLAEIYRPFAIVSDIIMPEIDGWEVLQVLKSKQETQDIPVIMVSVSNNKEIAFALGAVGYIQKPVNKQQLITEIYKLHQNPATVMIVDNDELDRKQLAEIINSYNIHTVMAESGKECLKLLQKYIPDVLVLDLLMPEMNGFEVLDRVRSTAELKNLPVIIVTAKDLTAQERERIAGKASSILTKDESISKNLLQEVKRILFELHQPEKRIYSKKQQTEPRILIVEDNEVAVIQIKKVLVKENFIVDIAPGGKQALDYMKYNKPDGIILDLMMPDVDGFEVLESIRGTEETKNIPVLILTAKDLTKEDLSKLSSNNIQQLIQKGDVDIDGLLFRVRLMLGNQPKFSEKQTHMQKTKERIVSAAPDPIKKEVADKNISGLPRVLVVEDNMDNMITIKAIIQCYCTVLEAFDGEQGLACAFKEQPDLILLDASLPRMDGLEVVNALKKDKKTQNIPVVAVTAHAMWKDKERFLSGGFDDYVTKPIDQELLLTVLDRWLKIRKTDV
ncbi:MAG: response regulator [Bacteroidetes bacterium]|nr:response regulator [Bacteroidota bacterium]